MRTSEVFAHYGTKSAVAKVLGITRQAVGLWDERGLVPPLSAAKLAKRSRGKLKFDPDLYEHWNRGA